MKVKKTFRIDEEIADKIAEIAESEGISLSEAIEIAIHSYVKKEQNAGSNSSDFPSEILSTFSSQLEEKDRQIERLQESLAIAQKLQAAEKQEKLLLESADQKAEKKNLLDKIRSLFS